MAKQRWKVKVTDFEKTAKIDPTFTDCVGLYKGDTRTIYIDSKLPRFSQGTMRSVYEHELVHAKLDAAGVEMKTNDEEALATLLSVLACPDKYQSNEERALKVMMGEGKRWTKKSDRRSLVKLACHYCGITTTPKLIGALS